MNPGVTGDPGAAAGPGVTGDPGAAAGPGITGDPGAAEEPGADPGTDPSDPVDIGTIDPGEIFPDPSPDMQGEASENQAAA